MPTSLQDCIQNVPADAQRRVLWVRDKYRKIIQDTMRDETRLVMRTPMDVERGQTGGQVPVNVVAGMPDGLSKIILPDDLDALMLLARHRDSLEKTAAGITTLLAMQDTLTQLPSAAGWPTAAVSSLRDTQVWAAHLLQRLEQADPLKKIVGIRQDVLGAYIYSAVFTGQADVNPARIELYWQVIGFVAGALGCAVEALATVTLTHELAHAYTQLGADIDGRRWPSSDFHKAELPLAEGLAQYYTERSVHRLEKRIPGVVAAFNALLKKQSDDYRAHEAWITDHDPEAVRSAMLVTRRIAVMEISRFEEILGSLGEVYPSEPVEAME